jgi:shikimate dehydrogenase
VVLFGAGGAARAIAVELALVGTRKITIVNRDAARGGELVETLRAKTNVEAELVVWAGDYQVPTDACAVINGTSIGLYEPEARLAVDLESLKPGTVVADVVFNPPRTRLLREAEARGCRVLDGLGMLVNQGVIGVQHWTGIDPDATVMRAALERAMGV